MLFLFFFQQGNAISVDRGFGQDRENWTGQVFTVPNKPT
jgi:hypothetical protein